MSFLSSAIYSILTTFTFLLALRYVILPFLFSHLTQFRVNAISIFNVAGFEWRPHADDVVPVLRVEKASWAWGGCDGRSTGWIVLRVDGLSLRVKSKKEDAVASVKTVSSCTPRDSQLLIPRNPDACPCTGLKASAERSISSCTIILA
jgi:hypothetical protein